MTITTALGAKFYIGTTLPVDTSGTEQDAIDDFEADVYTEVKEIESLGELGDEANDVTFAALADARMRHLKGVRDAGVMEIVAGRDPADGGQQAMKAAQKTKYQYNFKIEVEDAVDENHTNSVFYYRALVQSARDEIGEADNVIRTTFNVGINTQVYELPSAFISTP